MSADLFAEFGNFSQPSQGQQNPPKQQQQQPQHHQQPQAQAADPFSFSSLSFTTPSSRPLAEGGRGGPGVGQTQEQWSSFPPQDQQGGSSSANVWGDFTSFSQPAASSRPAQQQNADEDDGWGDFETAQPSAQPASVQPASVQPASVLSPSTPFGQSSAARPPLSQPQQPSMSAFPQLDRPAPSPMQHSAQHVQPRRVIRASTMDLISNNLVDVGVGSTSQPQWQPAAETSWTAPGKATGSGLTVKAPVDPNVLFDADNLDSEDEDEEEFGDFETVPSSGPTTVSVPSVTQLPSMDLLSLGDDTTAPRAQPQEAKKRPGQQLAPLSFGAMAETSPYPQAPKSPSFQERNPFPGLSISSKPKEPKKVEKPKSPSPVTAWPAFGDENTGKPGVKSAKVAEADDWGAAWEDLPPESMNSKTSRAKPEVPAIGSPPPSTWDWGVNDATATPPPAVSASPSKDDPPPINIPPPSILLSILPPLLDLADSALYGPLSGKSSTIKHQVTTNPQTITFLRSYLLLATVAARIIAARKLRWNRDKFLAKGMSISAAGSKGMKLAGIDKAQSTREEREAADVLAMWKAHVGKLRSAVAAANTVAEPHEQLKVPELAETMAVQTAKMVPTAPKACVVCGLKRDERVAKVDYEVEDSFGEWWVEFWGHRACKNFWLEHEKELRQR